MSGLRVEWPIWRSVLPLLACLAFIVGHAATTPTHADGHRFDLKVGGITRYYQLYTPERGRNYPLVLVFHGGMTSPEFIRRVSSYETLARQQGFAVAFMAGTGHAGSEHLVWNAGGCCASAMREHVDELSYVRAALREITGRFPVDRRRIYLVGSSNGGMLVQQLAEAMAGEIAAAAVIGGPRFGPVPPGPPVPMLLIHATGDTSAPFEGGYSRRKIIRRAMSAPFLAVPEGASGWAERNRCQTHHTGQDAGYQSTDYEGCVNGARVKLIAIDSDEHAWFGGERAPGSAVNATAATWDFLKSFSR